MARALSLTTGLVARIQRSHCCGPTSISGQEPKPCFKPLQAEATRDHIWFQNPGIQGILQASPSCGLRPLTLAPAFFLLLSTSFSFQDSHGITSVHPLRYGSPQNWEWQGYSPGHADSNDASVIADTVLWDMVET